MSDSPDAIRADIEQTRRELGSDVDALADKVSPSKIVDRQADKVKHAFGSVRDHVMGVADDAHDALGDAGATVTDVKDRVVAKAEGNPLAVGLIAFGAGLLLASLIPASDKEKELAADVKEQAEPLVETVTDAAKEVGAHLKEPAQEAAAAVKDTAADAVESVKADAQYAAGGSQGSGSDRQGPRHRKLTIRPDGRGRCIGVPARSGIAAAGALTRRRPWCRCNDRAGSGRRWSSTTGGSRRPRTFRGPGRTRRRTRSRGRRRVARRGSVRGRHHARAEREPVGGRGASAKRARSSRHRQGSPRKPHWATSRSNRAPIDPVVVRGGNRGSTRARILR